jgi:hypothetical protein
MEIVPDVNNWDDPFFICTHMFSSSLDVFLNSIATQMTVKANSGVEPTLVDNRGDHSGECERLLKVCYPDQKFGVASKTRDIRRKHIDGVMCELCQKTVSRYATTPHILHYHIEGKKVPYFSKKINRSYVAGFGFCENTVLWFSQSALCSWLMNLRARHEHSFVLGRDIGSVASWDTHPLRIGRKYSTQVGGEGGGPHRPASNFSANILWGR